MLSRVVRWFQNCFMFQSQSHLTNGLPCFQCVTGSEILQQGEGTSFPRASASFSLGFAFLPLRIKIVQV